MMILPSKEEIKLSKKIAKTKNIEEKRELLKKLVELSKKTDEQYANCPFAH